MDILSKSKQNKISVLFCSVWNSNTLWHYYILGESIYSEFS